MKVKLWFLLCALTLPFLLSAQKDAIQNEVLEFETLDSLYTKFLQIEDYRQALIYAKQGASKALEEYGELDSNYVSYALRKGYMYECLQKFKKAESIYIKLKEVQKTKSGAQGLEYADILDYLGRLYMQLGRYDAAEVNFLRVELIRRKEVGTKHILYADILGQLGYLYQVLGEYQKSELYYLEGMGLDRELLGEESLDYSYTLNNLGVLYYEMQQFEMAEPLYLQAKVIRKKILGVNNSEYAKTLNNLGALYKEMKLYSKAILAYRESLDIVEKALGKQHSFYALVAANLAKIYDKKGKHGVAFEFFEEAMDIKRSIYGEHHPRYAFALNDLARNYLYQGKPLEGRILLKKAALILFQTKGEQHVDYLMILNNLAENYYKSDSLEQATAYVFSLLAANSLNFKDLYPTLFVSNSEEEPLYIPENLQKDWKDIGRQYLEKLEPRHPFYTIVGLNRLLAIWEKESKEEHFKLSQAALVMSEHLQRYFNKDKDKLRFLSYHTTFAEHTINTAFTLKKSNEWLKAFSAAEQNKSMLLAEALKGSRAQTMGIIPDSLVYKENTLKKKQAEIRKAKLEARTPNELAIAVAKETKLNQESTKFLIELKESYPRYHALKYEHIIAKATEIQALLDDDALVLEFFSTDSVLYLFALDKVSIELFKLPVTKKELEQHTGNMRKALSDYKYVLNKPQKAYQLFIKEGCWFYKTLLEKALKNRSKEHLIFVSDGVLGFLPFEVFLTEMPSKGRSDYNDLSYLIKKYNISYQYSMTLWKENLAIVSS